MQKSVFKLYSRRLVSHLPNRSSSKTSKARMAPSSTVNDLALKAWRASRMSSSRMTSSCASPIPLYILFLHFDRNLESTSSAKTTRPSSTTKSPRVSSASSQNMTLSSPHAQNNTSNTSTPNTAPKIIPPPPHRLPLLVPSVGHPRLMAVLPSLLLGKVQTMQLGDPQCNLRALGVWEVWEAGA